MLGRLPANGDGSDKFLTTKNGAGFLSQMSRFGRISPGERSVWEKKDVPV
jgi:hypothetical protein